MDSASFMDERDRCRDRSYLSADPVLATGFFCNTDRRMDHVSNELMWAISVAEAYGNREAAIATVAALRLAGSPRESEGQGRGAFPLIWAAIEGRLEEHLCKTPFPGRRTYRVVT